MGRNLAQKLGLVRLDQLVLFEVRELHGGPGPVADNKSYRTGGADRPPVLVSRVLQLTPDE